MPRISKLDKLLELAKKTDNPELLSAIEELKKEKVKKVKKPRKPRKRKEIDINAEEEIEVGGKDLIFKTRTSGKVGFVKNQFIDDGKLLPGDKNFDKKYGKKFQVGPRPRPKARFINVNCAQCNRSEKVSSQTISPREDGSYYYICPRCVGSRR